jgi:ParB-like chromosome segregation protein Spo0J
MPEIQHKQIKHLKLLANNPRKIDKRQFQKLCNRLEKDPGFFDNRPCLVHLDEEDNFIVYAGNQRVKAAKKLGWKLVPCIVESGLSPEIIKERIVSDNVSMGEFDWDILSSDYDMQSLLDCGLTEKDLHLDLSLDDEKETAARSKKADKDMTCPHCGMAL